MKTRIQSRLRICVKTGGKPKLQYNGLYKGISMNTMSGPSGILYFWVYEKTKFHLEKKISYMSYPSVCHLLGGGLGELSSILVRNPFEVVKQQMQLGLDKRATDTFRSIYRLKGIKGSPPSPKVFTRVYGHSY